MKRAGIDRRQLLFAGAGLSGAALIGLTARKRRDGPAKPSASDDRAATRRAVGDRALVVVQLFGGNDGFNTCVRFEDDDYHRARPNLAVRKSATLPLTDHCGLHAAMPRLKEWWDRGRVAIVDGVGSDRTNLSHFKSEAVWEGAGDARDLRTGWLGRVMDQRIEQGLDAPSPVGMMALGRDVLPRSMRSARAAAPAIPDLDEFVRERKANPLDAVVAVRGSSVAEARLFECEDTLRAALVARERLAEAVKQPSLVGHPGTEIGRALAGAAKVLRARVGTRIVYATLGSFDTHAFQADEHAKLLHQLDEALNALMWDLHAQDALDRTLVVTVSEFGRRLAENGVGSEAGTDHGRSSMLFALGGGVRPGMYGAAPSFTDLDSDGNVRATTDFRRVYATIIERWLGADSVAALGAELEPLAFLGA